MRPALGLKPTTPQKDAGRSTEPLVCVPTASGTMPAATAAAEPLDDPPGVCAGLCGLRVGPGRVGGQLGGHGLAHHQRAGALQALHQQRVHRRLAAGVQHGAVLRGQVGGVDDVLQAHRHAVQRAALAGAASAASAWRSRAARSSTTQAWTCGSTASTRASKARTRSTAGDGPARDRVLTGTARRQPQADRRPDCRAGPSPAPGCP